MKKIVLVILAIILSLLTGLLAKITGVSDNYPAFLLVTILSIVSVAFLYEAQI